MKWLRDFYNSTVFFFSTFPHPFLHYLPFMIRLFSVDLTKILVMDNKIVLTFNLTLKININWALESCMMMILYIYMLWSHSLAVNTWFTIIYMWHWHQGIGTKSLSYLSLGMWYFVSQSVLRSFLVLA